MTVWTQDAFELTAPTLHALTSRTRRYDFAIFIFTPIDRLTKRDAGYYVPRDNVVFESGLFMGRLGPERVFLLEPSSQRLKLDLPFRVLSDLDGITRVKFDSLSSNLVASLGPTALRSCSRNGRTMTASGGGSTSRLI